MKRALSTSPSTARRSRFERHRPGSQVPHQRSGPDCGLGCPTQRSIAHCGLSDAHQIASNGIFGDRRCNGEAHIPAESRTDGYSGPQRHRAARSRPEIRSRASRAIGPLRVRLEPASRRSYP